MTFDGHRGTRGVKQPNSPFLRGINSLVTKRIKRKGGGTVMGIETLVLTTVGRKTGQERSVPIGFFRQDGSWLVVASANGAIENPGWYYNIAGNPDKVSVFVDGKTVAVTPEQLHGDEREAAWKQVIETSKRFAKYQTKTDREIPVIRLTPQPQA